MKITKVFIYIGLGLSLLSCGKAKESELIVEITGNNAYLINASAQSCSNKVAVALSPATASPASDISPHYYTYQGATLSWKNTTDTAYIIQAKIEFNNNSNVTKPCTIAGDELLSMFFDFDNNQAWDGSLAPATSVSVPRTKNSTCKIRCGGVPIADENKSFSAIGTMTWTGFQRNPDTGEEKPIKATTSVKLTYQ
ncbi:MAG TPA: hypothetical protein VIG33_18525 [Pseudobdellovibrionaceae bacterium]|jgi:uncharacterized surface anchored protein